MRKSMSFIAAFALFSGVLLAGCGTLFLPQTPVDNRPLATSGDVRQVDFVHNSIRDSLWRANSAMREVDRHLQMATAHHSPFDIQRANAALGQVRTELDLSLSWLNQASELIGALRSKRFEGTTLTFFNLAIGTQNRLAQEYNALVDRSNAASNRLGSLQ